MTNKDIREENQKLVQLTEVLNEVKNNFNIYFTILLHYCN